MITGVAPEISNSPESPVADPETRDLLRVVNLHLEASQHREELLEEVRQLQAAGRIREARRVRRTAEKLHSQLQALEVQVRTYLRESK
jgi:hypothetical protein